MRFRTAKYLTQGVTEQDTPRLGWNPGLLGSQVMAVSHPSLCARRGGGQELGSPRPQSVHL